MNEDVAGTHRMSNLSFNLAHAVLVADSLGNDSLGLALANDMTVEFGYKL